MSEDPPVKEPDQSDLRRKLRRQEDRRLTQLERDLLTKAEQSQQELQKRVFHLKTLYDLSREIGFLSDPQEIVMHLLMMIMGTFGSARGVILLFDLKKGAVEWIIQRGMDQESRDLLCRSVAQRYFQEAKPAMAPHIFAERDPILAALKIAVWVPFHVDENLRGGIGLGEKLTGDHYSPDDLELLSTLSNEGAAAVQQAREKEQRANLMQLFSKHVSPEVAEALWQQRDQFLDGGRPRSQKLMVTVMFTDLEGFSGVSEKMDPQVLMDWLNTYMEMIAKVVMDHGGVVDDYFGDGVKVNFGVPVPRLTESEIRTDAVNAVTCAMAFEKEMIRLNALMSERDLQTLRMRVGIFTGPVVAGSLGSADRMKYTTLGDTVNTASRLESFSKELNLPHLANSPCRILIGESTLRYLGDQFQSEQVGELSLKGKDQRIVAYCVIGRRA